MTTAKWLICNLGKDDHIQSLHYGVQEAGRDSQVVTLGEIAAILETTSEEKDCVIPCGSIWQNRSLKVARPNWIGNFHDKKTFSCSSYYSYWGKYLTQKRYMMFTLAEVIRLKDWIYQALSVNDQIFIRPNSGEKEFNGELIHIDRFTAWTEETLRQMSYNAEDKSLLCIVSSPVLIAKEFRLIVVDGKVVSGSTYRIARHIAHESIDESELPLVTEFAMKVMADNAPPLPPYFCLDIAKESDGSYSILEVGCFCCCGLYECDRKAVALAISESAERKFDEHQ